MKRVEAVISPLRLDAVREALERIGVEDVTVTETVGFGRAPGLSVVYQGAVRSVEFLTRVKLEVVVGDAVVPALIAVIQRTASTGKHGDGKIFVFDVPRAIRIGDDDDDLETGASEHLSAVRA